MSSIIVRSTSVGTCEVVHEASGAVVKTDLPPEYGGLGRSFSATDLLAAALGVCITTNIDRVAERHGIPFSALRTTVKKTLAREPKRVARLDVTITIAARIDDSVITRLRRAAGHCTVHRSLHPSIEVEIQIRSTMEQSS